MGKKQTNGGWMAEFGVRAANKLIKEGETKEQPLNP